MGKILEILDEPKIKQLREEVDKFCAYELDQYLNKMIQHSKEHTFSPNNTKNFYDSIWGTIEINEGEILLLNSPLLQRLRGIKQLGLVDLLYSSANHTRFSHTVGVLQTATSMWKQIERELIKNEVQIDKDVEQTIRLAAIFHDCGHMFCSHASERFFQSDVSYSQHSRIDEVRRLFSKKLNIKPSLSEIISLLMVCSKSVQQLLSTLDNAFLNLNFNNNNQKTITEKICCLILGFPYSKKTIPFSQIISGQIDSDKLDYLKRDSHSTGVPVAVDMSRVFQKLRMVPTTQQYSMLSDAYESCANVYKLGIAPAAINTIDQLVLSRYMMFENIYYHQKVLTSEEMLRYAVKLLDKSTQGLFDDFSVVLQLNDNILININFQKSVYEIETNNFKVNDEELYSKACKILKNLARRNLFKRCVSFTSENLTDVGDLNSAFYRKVFIDKDIEQQECFLKRVIEETNKIKHLLNEENIDSDTDILLITTPDIASASFNSNIAIADKINKDRNMVFEADNWLKSRTTRKPQNYLVSYEEDRYLVYIAVEKVLLEYYGLLINDAIIYDENDEKEILKIKTVLSQRGYYKNTCSLIPDAEIKSFGAKIEGLLKKWKTYERFDVEKGGRTEVDYTILTSYIKQFYRFSEELGDYDIFVRGCLNMLENIEIVTRNDIFQYLQSNIETIIKELNCKYEDIQICSLGTVQDGASQISYQINEINQNMHTKFVVRQLEEIFVKDLKPVVMFVEDAFFSAKQIMSMFETYMGIPVEKRQTTEEHVKELSEDMKEKLKKTTIYFSFMYYNKDNKDRFLRRLKELGLEDVKIISHKEFPIGYFKNKDVQDVEAYKVTEKYFRKAGEMLIKEKAFLNGEQKAQWPDERINSSFLGYNDAQQLIVFPWNTPTYSLTALWLWSKNQCWYPIFQRIDK